jgi:hypothetical protein
MTVIHDFTDNPIQGKLFLTSQKWKESEVYTQLMYNPPKKSGHGRAMNSKSAFYVLRLPACAQAIKIGKSTAQAGGIIARLHDYLVKYGNFKIIFLKVFNYQLHSSIEDQPVSKFEKKILKKLPKALRGAEYFPTDALDEIKNVINGLPKQNEEPELNENPNVRKTNRVKKSPSDWRVS